jgi:ADP-heptose:LPS heptosyltransferase
VRGQDRPVRTASVLVVEIWGGMGDALLATPAIRALKQRCPDAELRVLCKENHVEILEFNPYLNHVSTSEDDPLLRDAPALTTSYGMFRPSVFVQKHATAIIADMLAVALDDWKLDVTLTRADEEKALNIVAGYRNPISLHVSSSSLRYKDWPLERWEELVRRLPECTFIQLGETRDPGVPSTIDVRGMTTVREAVAVVKHTRCFVGIDSFFNHASIAVGTPGVVLFGPSTPVVWGHAGNTNLYAGVECSPCVDTIDKNPCPFARRCMTAIGVDEVEAAVRRILGL